MSPNKTRASIAPVDRALARFQTLTEGSEPIGDALDVAASAAGVSPSELRRTASDAPISIPADIAGAEPDSEYIVKLAG